MSCKSMPGRAVWMAMVAFLAASPSFLPADLPGGGSVFGREDYPPLVELRKISYESKEGKQTVHIVMNLHADVPKGTKLIFELHYLAQPYVAKTFQLKDENRKLRRSEARPHERVGGNCASGVLRQRTT